MPINFVPDAGDVLICDFADGEPPEMTKTRRVVVMSPRCRTRFPSTFLVVPLSKTPPVPREVCHCDFRPGAYAFFDRIETIWAKADMITCVAARRLDRVKMNGRYTGCRIRKDDLERVRRSVLHALGIGHWREVEVMVRSASVSLNDST